MHREKVFNELRRKFPHDVLKRESSEGIFDFLHGLIRLRRPDHVVEMGCFHGETTAFMVQALYQNERGVLSAYDVLESACDHTETLLENLFGDEDERRFLVDKKDLTKVSDEGIQCDFAFIDVDPKSLYPQMVRKLQMPKEATVCLHDTFLDNVSTASIAPALEMLTKLGFKTINMKQERGLAVCVRS